MASNVAPSTATISVTHNFLFKMAYGGMHCFKPMEVMWPCTSNALMGSLLLHDICNEDGPNRGATSLSETDDHFTNPWVLKEVSVFFIFSKFGEISIIQLLCIYSL